MNIHSDVPHSCPHTEVHIAAYSLRIFLWFFAVLQAIVIRVTVCVGACVCVSVCGSFQMLSLPIAKRVRHPSSFYLRSVIAHRRLLSSTFVARQGPERRPPGPPGIREEQSAGRSRKSGRCTRLPLHSTYSHSRRPRGTQSQCSAVHPA